MFGKLRKRVGDFAKQITNATPGLGDRPAVETFKEVWNQVQVEHSDLLQRTDLDLDDPGLLGQTNIQNNLDTIVSILIREDRGIIKDSNALPRTGGAPGQTGKRQESHGPLRACLEYTLENRVFSDLCAKGLADRPRGMMRLILDTIHYIIRGLRHPLLPYRSAHQPLCQLVRVCAEAGSPDARERLISLLKTLWVQMRKNPSQLEFFYSPATSTRTEQLDMFLVMLPYMLVDSEAGERARFAMLCVSSICDAHLLDYVANKTQFCAQLCAGLNQAFRELTEALGALPAGEGDPAPHLAARLAQATRKLELIWQFANALSIPGVAVGLQVASRNLGATSPDGTRPVQDEPPVPDDQDETPDGGGEEGIMHRTFEILTEAIVSSIRDDFLMASVVPALLATSEQTARDAMLAVCILLESMAATGQELRSPALWTLVSILVSTELDPDNRRAEDVVADSSAPSGPEEGQAQSERLRHTLLFRLDSMSPQVSTAALKLFSALLDLNDPRILHSLVLRQLYPGNHLVPAGEAPSAPLLSGSMDLRTPTKSAHARTPRTPQTPGRTAGSNAVEFLDKYPGSPKPPALSSSRKRHITSQEQQDLIAFEAYLTDGQGQAAAKIAAYMSQISTIHTQNTSPARLPRHRLAQQDAAALSPVGSPLARGAKDPTDPQADFSEGIFLTLLLNKLERMLETTLEECLVLTGILAKLAQCPHRILHAYLFEEEISVAEFLAAASGQPCRTHFSPSSPDTSQLLGPRPGVRTLSSALRAVWKEASERVEDLMPEFASQRAAARARLGVDDSPTPAPASAFATRLLGVDVGAPAAALSRVGLGGQTLGGLPDSTAAAALRVGGAAEAYSSGNKVFVEAHIVLEEFLKELASTLQAKQNLMDLQLDLSSDADIAATPR